MDHSFFSRSIDLNVFNTSRRTIAVTEREAHWHTKNKVQEVFYPGRELLEVRVPLHPAEQLSFYF